MTTQPTLLVADIGGTNTRVALSDGATIRVATVRRYANAAHGGLTDILRTFLDETGQPECAGACIAVAGPVHDNRAQMTNLDWLITPDDVAKVSGAPLVRILNDLQAQGHALGNLAGGKVTLLCPARSARAPSIDPPVQLVIGVGTGFNAAAVHDVAGLRLVTASESGHATLPVMTSQDFALSRDIAARNGFAAIEDVLSGRGLAALYRWHAAQAGSTATPDAAEIMTAIADGQDPVALAVAGHFMRMLGRVAGDLALSYLPFGGIYLIGGVARAFRDHYATYGFSDAFRDKGRFTDFLGRFSIHLVEDDYAALTGCAACLAQQLGGAA
ncbi:MAG: glucokinase [Rhodobacteraceae bacterium]|nr:glucokinase [Paracoccaceae bacterium]